MMTENEIRELLSDYLDGELDRATRRQVEEGLRRFPSTRKTLEQLSRTVNLISAMPRVEPPPNMAAVIAERARRQVALTNSGRQMLAKRARFVLWQRMGAAAAVLAAGCLAAFGVWRAQLQLTPSPQIVVFDSGPQVDPETVGSNPIAGRTERERAAMETAARESTDESADRPDGGATGSDETSPAGPGAASEPSREPEPRVAAPALSQPAPLAPSPLNPTEEAEKRKLPFVDGLKSLFNRGSKSDAEKDANKDVPAADPVAPTGAAPGDRKTAADEKASTVVKTAEPKADGGKVRGTPPDAGFGGPFSPAPKVAPKPSPKPVDAVGSQGKEAERLAEQRRLQQLEKKLEGAGGRGEPGKSEPGKTKSIGGIEKPVFVLSLSPATRSVAKAGDYKSGKPGEAKPQNGVGQSAGQGVVGQGGQGLAQGSKAYAGKTNPGGKGGIVWTSARRNDRTSVERLREQLDNVQAANQAAAAQANQGQAAAPPQAGVQQIVQFGDEQRQEAFAGIVVVRGDEVKIRAGLREAMAGLEKRGVVRWAEQADGRLASFTLTTDEPADVDNVFRVLDLSPGITRVDLAPSAECVQVLADADADRRAKDGKETQFASAYRDGKSAEKSPAGSTGGKAAEPSGEPNTNKKVGDVATVHPDGGRKPEAPKSDEPAAKLAVGPATDPQAPQVEAGKFKQVQEAARAVARRQNAIVASNLRVFQQRLIVDADQLRKANEAARQAVEEVGKANRAVNQGKKDQNARTEASDQENRAARPAITLIVTIQPAPAGR